jgi:uncharacterized protein
VAPAIVKRSTPAPDSPSCASGWISVLRFTVLTVLSTGVLTALAVPLIDLEPWRIFRRCASIGAALSLWICATRFDHRSFRSFGLQPLREGQRGLRAGLMLGAGTLLVMLGIGLLTGACEIAVSADQAKLWRTMLLFLPGAVLVSVLEELIFRGYLLQHLVSCSPWIGIVVSSAAYALVHLKTPEWTTQTWLELGGLYLLGTVLSLTALRTRSLSMAIGLHAALAYGARVNKLLIRFPDGSDAWLTGTSRLVNGLIGWLALGLIGGMVWWWTRRAQGGGGNERA